VGDRATDRVDRCVTDDEVEVGTVRTEGVVAGRTDVRACLPPAVLAADNAWLQGVVLPTGGVRSGQWRPGA
jgi:hypothetical protein